MGEYVIDIPNWQPTPLNKMLGHWRQRASLKMQTRRMVWAYSRHIKAGDWPIPKRSVELTIILEPGQRACDPDAYWKDLLDALVHAYALRNDSHKWCELLPVGFERAARFEGFGMTHWQQPPILRDLLVNVVPAPAAQYSNQTLFLPHAHHPGCGYTVLMDAEIALHRLGLLPVRCKSCRELMTDRSDV